MKDVYDLINCGPRHRFVVRGADGRELIVSNCVQGASRDIFALALVDLDADGVELVHHVHDECIAQAPIEHAEDVAHMMQVALTKERPGFEGLPLACEGGISKRWQK